MTASKKPVRRRTQPKSRSSAATGVLDKYGSKLKLFANYGAAGLFGGYLLIVTIPDLQKQAREDRERGREHGDRAVDKIAGSVDGLRDVFQSNQKAGHQNQRESIAIQEKMAELLEKQGSAKDAN